VGTQADLDFRALASEADFGSALAFPVRVWGAIVLLALQPGALKPAVASTLEVVRSQIGPRSTSATRWSGPEVGEPPAGGLDRRSCAARHRGDSPRSVIGTEPGWSVF